MRLEQSGSAPAFARSSRLMLGLIVLALGACRSVAAQAPGAEALVVGAQPSALCGDCTQDGRVDIVDALRAAQDLLSSSGAMSKPLVGRGRLACDLNGDRRIDMIDVMQIVHASQRGSETRGSGGAHACVFERLELPTAVVGVAYEARLDESVAPESATLVLLGVLPTGLGFQADERIIGGVPVEAGRLAAELEVRLESGGVRYYALDVDIVALPAASELEYARDGQDALVVSRLVELPAHFGTLEPIAAIVPTPRAWRQGMDPALLVLLAAGDQVFAVVGHDDAMAAGGGWTCWTVPIFRLPEGGGIRGMVFLGDTCYLVDDRGAVHRLDGHDGALESLVTLGTFPELAGATSLTIAPAEGTQPAGLVVTVRDFVPPGEESLAFTDKAGAGSVRQVVFAPFARIDPERFPVEGTTPDLRVASAPGGLAVAAAHARSVAGAPLGLYVRRQPEQLVRVTWPESGGLLGATARPVMPHGLLPEAALGDAMVAVAGATRLVYSARGQDGADLDQSGVWMLTMDGSYTHERLVGGFSPTRPASALAHGAASLGTGGSVYVLGNLAVYELLGSASSLNFRF